MKKVDFGGLFHKKFVSKNSFAYQVMAELDGIPTELGGVMNQLRWVMILFCSPGSASVRKTPRHNTQSKLA
ncbi:MAG: hypothetical protein J6X49_10495 [Victivallales bacterium]|nr:hypothetical protein [Victivallales bacterium]